jgi:uncharacterized coiled-coil protein SlyX
MREKIEARLAELRAEAARGEQALAELDAKRAELGRVMLRISGAVQVLEETLAAADGPVADGDSAAGGSAAGGSAAGIGSAAGGPASPAGPAADGSTKVGPIGLGPIPDGPAADGSASPAGSVADEAALAPGAA